MKTLLFVVGAIFAAYLAVKIFIALLPFVIIAALFYFVYRIFVSARFNRKVTE